MFDVQLDTTPNEVEVLTRVGTVKVVFDSADEVRILTEDNEPVTINGIKYRVVLNLISQANYDDREALAAGTHMSSGYSIVKAPAGVWVSCLGWLATYDHRSYALHRIGSGEPTASAYEQLQTVIVPAVVQTLIDSPDRLTRANVKARDRFRKMVTTKVEELEEIQRAYQGVRDSILHYGGSLNAGYAMLNELSDPARMRKWAIETLNRYLVSTEDK